MELTTSEILLRLVISAVLGCAVGIERERLNWVAGMRTHMLVCVGSTLIMMVSMYGFGDVLGHKDVVLDPSRVAAQVVSGIGFLGAGTIFFWRKEIIRGLTTAAALWAVAGIGLAIGGGMYIAGVATTVLALIILSAMKPVEKLIMKKESFVRHSLVIKIKNGALALKDLNHELEDQGIKIIEMKTVNPENPEGRERDFFEVYISGEGGSLLEFAEGMKSRSGVLSITYT